MIYYTGVFSRPMIYWIMQPIVALASIVDGLVRLLTLGVFATSITLRVVRWVSLKEHQEKKRKLTQ